MRSSLRSLLAVLTLLSVPSGCTRAPHGNPDAAPLEPGLTVAAGDVRIFAREVGGAPTLIVVNGGPGASHHSAARLAALASPSLRVVLYDQRGMAGSTAPADPAKYALDDYAADLEALRRGLGVEKVHVLGHSNGGLVAMAYAAAHGDRVASLTLVSARAPDWDDDQAASRAFELRVGALIEAKVIPADPPPAAGDDCRATTNAFLPALFADPAFLARAGLSLDEARDTACSTRVREATEARLPGYDLRPRLAAFRGPTLIVAGESDPFGSAPREATEKALVGAHPDVAVLPKCGHFPWIECNDAFMAAVRPFLARVTAT